ncbi:MAG: NADH:flavin oxidoreductase [Alistipes sp.]|nr:NADH:flavin oxidoreductase [Alistipes sp.]
MAEKKDLKESKLFTPYKLNDKVTLRNRTIRSAAFESMGKDFNPTQKLKDYHVSVAKGGVGITTLAYASINRSGVSFNSQLWLRDEVIEPLKDITDAIHAEGAAAGIQIGHCGNMTHWSTAGSFPVSASNGFNLYSPTFHRRMSHKEIEQTAKDFGKAVHLAHESGFDSVEVHAGHGYLISQFLSPWTNRRRDEFGGSLENRMRFMKMCLNEVMEAAAKTGTAVLVKHNMEDGFKSGIQIPESIEIAKEIEKFNVNGIVLSSGFVSRAPMAVMRGRIPTKTMSYYMGWNEWLQKIVVDLFGHWMIKDYKFEECFFLENAKKFRAELKGPLVYVGGIVSREGIEKVLDAGFEMVQMARCLINDPTFVNKMKEGDISTRSGCDHRDYCIARMYSKDMQCCHNCKEHIPDKVWKELAKID